MRKASSQPWPADAQDERLRDTLAQELIGVCMQALKSFGLDGKRLSKMAARKALGASRRGSTASELLTDVDHLGCAISKWAEDPA
jgi:hypothetical protein